MRFRCVGCPCSRFPVPAINFTILGLTQPLTLAIPQNRKLAVRKTIWLWRSAGLGYFTLLLFSIINSAAPAQQQTSGLGISSSVLPDAPLPQSEQSSADQPSATEGSASVSGVVLDISGAAIAGAKVSLTSVDGSRRQVLTSGANGEFSFPKLSPGSSM
jgi:hypothetical protein